MAVCIALMCGRLGAVAGANILGLLIDSYCDLAFLSAGLSQICEYSKFVLVSLNITHVFFVSFFG